MRATCSITSTEASDDGSSVTWACACGSAGFLGREPPDEGQPYPPLTERDRDKARRAWMRHRRRRDSGVDLLVA
jgi:hypothetical protein